jgi:hypothetical protein
MAVTGNKTVLRKGRVRTSEPNSLTLRARFERTLAAIDLHPPSLPPSAILCVREVRDRSGGLKLRTDLDFAAVERWRQTIVSMLGDLANRAARPAHEPVPAGTEAVLFADQAELLACLALDWCRGRLAEHWWWAGLFPNGSRPYSWTAIWQEHPEFIPAAVHSLAERRELPTVARSVGSNDAGLLLSAMVQQFALREVALALAQTHVASFSTTTPPSTNEIRPSTDIDTFPPQTAGTKISARALLPLRPGQPVRGARLQGVHPPLADQPCVDLAPLKPPPWRPWISETELPSDLGVEEQFLFGLAVMLQRATRLARSAPFAEAILNWIGVPPPSSRSPTPVVTGEGQPVAIQTAAEKPIREVHSEAFTACSCGSSGEQGLSATEVPLTTSSAVEATSPVWFHEQAGSAESSDGQNDAGLSSSLVQPDALLTTPLLPQPWLAERKIETNFGGVFYLINAALQLGLYGDFTTPLQPGLALPIGDFLALVGRELAGPELVGDPLWRLLAELDGRSDDEAPGAAQFDPPVCWQLPADWLKAFPEASVWHWSVHADRVRIEHPEGFTIVDLPANSETADAQLRTAIEAYACLTFELRADPVTPVALAAPPVGCPPSTFNSQLSTCLSLQRWLDWLCRYLRARLPRALGFPAGSSAALTLLLQQSARVQTSATHLRVFFSLAQHPLEIRIAGLDRDPGWVPAAGRHVAFYYE